MRTIYKVDQPRYQSKSLSKCVIDDLLCYLTQRTFDVNTFSHFWLNKQLLPSMISRKSGQIVAICSIAGLTGTTNLVDYWLVLVVRTNGAICICFQCLLASCSLQFV